MLAITYQVFEFDGKTIKTDFPKTFSISLPDMHLKCALLPNTPTKILIIYIYIYVSILMPTISLSSLNEFEYINELGLLKQFLLNTGVN